MMNVENVWRKISQGSPEKIWIQRFSGGLGNQISEYVFYRYAQRRRQEITWIWDDMFYYATGYQHLISQFEQIFCIKLNRTSQYYEKDTFGEILRLYKRSIYLPQVLLNCGIPIATVSDWKSDPFKGITIEKPFRYFPEILDLPYRYVYSASQFKEKCWFMQDREENIAELSFPPFPDAKNLTYADEIQSHFSTGIHIRRGDFLQAGLLFEENSYRKGCEIVVERYPDAYFFVFSDDLDWCKSHADELGLNLAKHTIYVSGNEEASKNYIDMQLMSMCKGIIRLAISTFSESAAWLARDLAFEVLIGDLYAYHQETSSELHFFERPASKKLQ